MSIPPIPVGPVRESGAIAHPVIVVWPEEPPAPMPDEPPAPEDPGAPEDPPAPGAASGLGGLGGSASGDPLSRDGGAGGS